MGWVDPLITVYSDGPTLTAAAAASCIPSYAKRPIRGDFWYVGRTIVIEAQGRISCVVTTPGTARFDMRLGGTNVFDTLAIPLNIVAKTTVGWYLRIIGTCRAAGTTANIWAQGHFLSEAVVGSPLPSAGGSGDIVTPYNVTPQIGNNFDGTIDLGFDFFFTQTVATGSMTLHSLQLYALNERV